MKNERTGFTMVYTPEQITEKGLNHIRKMAYLPESDISLSEVHDLWQAVYKLNCGDIPSISPAQFEKLLFKYRIIGNNRETSENRQSFLQTVELIEGRYPGYKSYGLFAPAYEDALREHKKTWKSPIYRSLLIGALTAETAMEYTASTRSVFPKAETYIMDIEGENTRRTPGFLLGDGLNIPIKDNSLSCIQTNYLLHMLKDGDGQQNGNMERLIGECWRCLGNNGVLIWCEGNINKVEACRDMPDFLGLMKIEAIFRRQGFTNFAVNSAKEFYSRQAMLRHYSSSDGNENPACDRNSGSMLITATKKQDVIYL